MLRVATKVRVLIIKRMHGVVTGVDRPSLLVAALCDTLPL